MTDKIKEALELIDHYDEEYWWFDPDLIIHESMNALLAERGRLQAREEILLEGIAKALVHDDFRTHLTNALAALKEQT